MRKKITVMLLVSLILLSVAGCYNRDASESSAAFYYTRAEFDHGSADSMITSEIRDINGRHDDLVYVLNLYLRGPSDDALKSPFPSDTRLISMVLNERSLDITLSNNILSLSSADLAVACTCMAKTCIELAQAESVTICTEVPIEQNGIRITMTADDWVLVDDSADISQITEPEAPSE